ncbi:MAG: hypothetical protein ABI663_05260 [Chryseolinea sp.]
MTKMIAYCSKKHALRHLPVVILSSTHSNQDIITQVYKAGADYYVRKHGDLAELQLLFANLNSV